MSRDFTYFVIFAEMRTGSNLLESNLNELAGLSCYGEAYNPHFIGYPSRGDICGFTQNMREADPLKLLDVIRQKTAGLPGFRYFHDHDPRVLDHILADPSCAKIILTRNPVDSFVSWKIAAQTGQWKLTNMKHQKSAQVRFDATEFDQRLARLQAFQRKLLKGLQTTGQTAFYIGYDDLKDIEVLNGLADFLGVEARLERVSEKLKKQNPGALRDKVVNYDEMEASLSRIDLFDLNRTPNFEPRRHAVVPTYIAAATAPVLFMPVKGGPTQGIEQWLADLDGVAPGDLISGFTQKSLRQWKRRHPGHRSFTVLRHPVERLHAAFSEAILSTGPGSFGEIRSNLRQHYKLPIPKGAPGPDYDAAAHRAAFLAFAEFVKANLNGQTSIRVDPLWASQSQVIKGLASFGHPDLLLREDQLEQGLRQLSEQAGTSCPSYAPPPTGYPVALSAIYDGAIEAAVREAYQRDYMMFGFSTWA